jgi:hypothetical protein
MAGEMEAIGGIVDGVMVARAVEPHAGEGGGHDAHGSGTCLNCGTKLIGSHCHCCGQNAHVHRTVGAIGHEIAHGVFHFEGKIWRTLPMLALRPGELTRRYVAGERARFVSPMAVFLFSVFLLFAVVAQLPGWHMGDTSWINEARVEDARAAVAKQRDRAAEQVKDLDNDLAEARTATTPDPARIARLTEKRTEAMQAQATLSRTEQMLPDTVKEETGAHSKSGWLNAKLQHAKENPQLMLYKIKSSAYKFSWLLIPLSLPFLWLLFPLRRGVGMYDHAVFATYSLSFMSLLAITLAVLGAVGTPSGVLVFAWLLIPPFHIYKQLKGAYSLSRVGALWRTVWLLFFITIITTLFTLVLLYLGTAE